MNTSKIYKKCNDDTVNLTARDEDGDKDLSDNLFTVGKTR